MDYKLIYLARRNPAISPSEWPRAWRSHAVFASQFPVLGARISSLVYCSRVFQPELDGAPADLPGLTQAHDGVAIVASPLAESLGGTLTPENRARIDADELRVFAEHTPNFSLHAREVLVEGAAHGPAAVIRFLARRSEDTREDFLARWNGPHAELATRASRGFGEVTRHVHNELIQPPPPGYPFDGVSETWFASEKAAVRSFGDTAMGAAAADLERLGDPALCVTVLTRVIHRWPRA